MLYVLQALKKALEVRKPDTISSLISLLDLVALGLVADVVPLDVNNRRLIKAGLEIIRAGGGRSGINALLEVAGKNPRDVVSADSFGFAVGPGLNAAGRIDDMTTGVRLLLTRDPAEAEALAKTLDGLNPERKELENRMRDEASASLPDPDRLDRYGLTFYSPEWHEGVIGIVASRIKDRWFRPAICFAAADDGKHLKGSARGVVNFHLRDALQEIDVKHPGIIVKYGGHAAAAGLSIRKERYEDFVEAFDEVARAHLTETDIAGTIETDGELDPANISLDMAQLIRDAGPWGQAFPEPVFDGVFRVDSFRVVGQRHLKMRLVDARGATHDAMAFFAVAPGDIVDVPPVVRAAYQLDVNNWNGQSRLQLLVQYFDAEHAVEIAA